MDAGGTPMPAPLDCPGIECWRALFGGALPPDEQARTGTRDVGHYPSRQIALTYHYPRAPEIYRAAERFS